MASAGIVSTHFAFSHKMFAIPDVVFKISQDGRTPALFMKLDELTAALPVNGLFDGMSIPRESADGKLLSLIEKSLKFVKEVRPGDSIPNELLDGSASWSVEEHHRETAKARVSAQLISWMTGDMKEKITTEDLQRLAEDPTIKQRFNQACDELASQMGLGTSQRDNVLKMAEDLARELAYIEALRDRFALVMAIKRNLERFEKLYSRERMTAEEVMRTRTLMAKPLKKFLDLFEKTESRPSQLVSIFRSIDSQIRLIRDCRDSLHHQFMKWDEMIRAWQDVSIESGPDSIELIKRTYRFMCTNFPNETTW
ncbi:MAG: hypothetical protein ABL996_20510 [Micropepsaceae bacterium]